ncbi:MAG: TAXI family TRAP transporter solute-binding subunit [Clostridiales bacterium]|nr:TAXI family TRAP transporter solute-binding subunit [Clostridiales bacterium]
MKRILALVFALCLLTALPASAVTVLTMGTGGTAGTYYAFGSEIATMWNRSDLDVEVTPLVTGASKANIVEVCDGGYQLGWSQNDTIFYAYNGDKDIFEGEKFDNFYAMAALYPEAVHLVVAADGDIKNIEDLKGKAVSIGAAGSGTSINALQILELAGLTTEDIKVQWLSFDESSTAFQNMTIDAFFVTAGIPNTGIISAAIKRPVRLISLTDEQMATLQEKYSFYVPVKVPAGTYEGQEPEVTIPSITATIIVAKDLDEELVYNLTKALFEKKGEMTHAKAQVLDPAFAVEGIPCPIHPGAAKYFTEVGVEIPEQSKLP